MFSVPLAVSFILFVSQIFLYYSSLAIAKPVISQGISIVGDQEMPQILYIIPWKKLKLPSVLPPDTDIIRQISYNPCQLILTDKTNKAIQESYFSCLLQVESKK